VPSPGSRVCPRAQRRAPPADGRSSSCGTASRTSLVKQRCIDAKRPTCLACRWGECFAPESGKGRASAKDLHLRNLHHPTFSTSVRQMTVRTPRTGCTRRRRACGWHACP